MLMRKEKACKSLAFPCSFVLAHRHPTRDARAVPTRGLTHCYLASHLASEQ